MKAINDLKASAQQQIVRHPGKKSEIKRELETVMKQIESKEKMFGVEKGMDQGDRKVDVLLEIQKLIAEEERIKSQEKQAGARLGVDVALGLADDEIERELARLFPSESEGQLHGIYPGARYQPQAHDIFETSAIRTMLDLEIHRSEYRVTRQRGATSLKR